MRKIPLKDAEEIKLQLIQAILAGHAVRFSAEPSPVGQPLVVTVELVFDPSILRKVSELNSELNNKRRLAAAARKRKTA